MLTLYNTLSRQKENFSNGEKVNLFVCGPTVYDYSHIGHARTYIFFDFFVKYLRSQGRSVYYLQNITDIDDKIIKRAAEENKDPLELAKEFTKKYLDDMKALGVDAVTKYAPATEFIPDIIGQVERLIKKRYAYKIDGDGWYFDISKDDDYGKLSGRNAAQAEDAISRIDDAVGKKNKGDFCLWKFSKPGEPMWESKIGNGRPGWHIEDTAITEKFFGPQYDIHGGGVDLKFPHHEAEIAQQECASGLKPFVKIWMHTGQLLVDGKKMSKSLGNFITVREFLEKYPADALRWITFTHHYRAPLDYTEALAEQAAKHIWNLSALVRKMELITDTKKSPSLTLKTDSLDDDLNTVKIIAELFEDTNVQNVTSLFGLFGISLLEPVIPSKIEQLAKEREQCRTNQQFVQSDTLRKEINDLGYEIEDTPKGPFLWPRFSLSLW